MSISHVLQMADLGEFTGYTAQYLDTATGRWISIGDTWPHGRRAAAVADAAKHRSDAWRAHRLRPAAEPEPPAHYRILTHVITTTSAPVGLDGMRKAI